MPFPPAHPSLLAAITERGYLEPTPVQAAVLEPGAVGRDLLVSAQTGSGKTVAYGLAIAATLLGEAERFDSRREPVALVIAPTRELALQVQRELGWLFAKAGARVESCVGGMDIRTEHRALMRLPMPVLALLLRAYFSRPWVDMGTGVFTHMERSALDELPDGMVSSVEIVGMLDRRHPFGISAITRGDVTSLTFVHDPAQLSDAAAAELAELYQSQLARIPAEGKA